MPHIRPTIQSDSPAIIDLIAAIFREYGLTLDVEHEDTHLLDPGPYFRRTGGEFWVVEDETPIAATTGDRTATTTAGRIVATVGVLLHEDAGELKCLYVSPALRRQGWGRRLSELTIDHARRAGRHRMILWTDTRFQDAHRLYERLGFRRSGQRDLADSNQTIEYGYEMTIAPPPPTGI